MITRRGLFGILAGAVAAPIVVRSGLLMPVKALKLEAGPFWATYTVTHTYPANAFWFTRGDILRITGLIGSPPEKIQADGYTATLIAAAST